MTDNRTLALITGACGGMGQACARRLGNRYRLALADVDQARIDAFAETLRSEGYDVALAQALDVALEGSVRAFAQAAAKAGRFGALVHTAGVSTALASWDRIMTVNLAGTVHMLDAAVPLAEPGSVAVCIASIAGHTAPAEPAIDAVLDAPLAPDFLSRMEPILRRLSEPGDPFALGTPAYNLSKRGIIRLVERRVQDWAQRGARIVSISPGLTWTPMLTTEMKVNPRVAPLAEMAPAKRFGTPLDIAAAADFLCSDDARYITGCDLRVDGGLTPLMMGGVAF